MAIAPIFKFKNIKTRITTANTSTFIYGVVAYPGSGNNTLDPGISTLDVTSVVLTLQISNLTTGPVTVNSWVLNSSTISYDDNNARVLVRNYPLIPSNAFDPLSGNLVLGQYDQLWVSSSIANGCDVIVSILEIANATAS